MSDSPKIVTACMVVIGNEILSGRTRDSNMHFIAGRLTELGVRLREARFIPDVEETIIAVINEVRAKYDYVFTSGGIGPTHDDITADSMAKAFGVGIDVNPVARARLEAHYEAGQLTPARLRMARIPLGASLIDNPVSKAPGFRLGNVFVMAGVPSIMQAMFEGVTHELVGGDRLLSRTVSSPMPEGQLAEPLGALQLEYPDVDLGSYPFFRSGRSGTSIVLRSTDRARLDMAAEEMKKIMRAYGVEPIEGESP